MKLIVGLGNPGREYEQTRHNAGWLALDRLITRHAPATTMKARFQAMTWDAQVSGEKALLMKPTTYMNLSGQSVAEAVRFFKMDPWSDVFVLTDDVAIPCGTIRIRASGSAGGHNGLADIERRLGGNAYARCRIGIDPAPAFIAQHDWVLGRFTPEQLATLAPALEQAADSAELWAREGPVAAMNRFNGKAGEKAREKPDRKKGPGANAGAESEARDETRGS
ncbi:MAG: aminoacyl-tRNA hydrolase [Phycisphaeraceae bacterium]|nr:aminoacyl-tRNA hydrolase [Phycisphaeraceae bacterium]